MRRRVGWFRLAGLLIAVLPFVVAELYLRGTRDVDSADLSSDPIFADSKREPLFVPSDDGTQMVIPKSRMEFFRPAQFAATKRPNVRRIFVLGGSTVQGRPYETETAFAKWVELRLRAYDPDHEYEVVNCGGVSYASYRVAIILHEVLQHSPDAIVLYTGHNEYLEERSYNTIASRENPLQRFADASYLVRAISRELKPTDDDRQSLSPELKTRLDLINGMDLYVRDDRWRRGVEEHFSMTLDRMIQMCRVAGVPLVLCMPTSDIVRTPPMKVENAPLGGEALTAFESNLRIAQDIGVQDARRIAACRACLAIDPHHAGAHYIAGVLHWKHQHASLAKQHLIAARDDDVCPLRATTPIVDAISRLADQHEIDLVRCDEMFDQTDSQMRPLPDGIPDPQRFVDHVHPTVSGHQEIAIAISDRLMRQFQIQSELNSQSELVYQQWVTEHLNTLDETYYARAKERLKGLQNWASGRAGRLAVEPGGAGHTNEPVRVSP